MIGVRVSRRWVPVYHLITEPTAEPGHDRLVTYPPMATMLDRNYQYRVIFDPALGVWRVDMRVDAPTASP